MMSDIPPLVKPLADIPEESAPRPRPRAYLDWRRWNIFRRRPQAQDILQYTDEPELDLEKEYIASEPLQDDASSSQSLSRLN